MGDKREKELRWFQKINEFFLFTENRFKRFNIVVLLLALGLDATFIKFLKPILCKQKEFVYFLKLS